MCQIIKEEFRKIFKKKSFLFLFVVLLVFSGYFTYQNYQSVFLEDNFIMDEHNEKLSGVEALRYIDEKRHAYAGTIDSQLVHNFYNDYQSLFPDEGTLQVDDAAMRKHYGDDYERLYEKFEEGKLTYQELNEAVLKAGNHYASFNIDNDMIIDMQVFYKEDAYVRGLNSIYSYLRLTNYDSLEAVTKQEVHEVFMPFLNRDRMNKEDKINLLEADSRTSMDTAIIDYYYQELMQQEAYYDSDLGNYYLFENMSHPLLLTLPLILIAIMLCDMFSLDKQCRCDQIIMASKYGNAKVRGCRVLVGFLTAIGVVVMQQLVIIAVSVIMLPIHSFDMSVLSLMPGNLPIANSYIQSYSNILLSACLMIPLAATAIAAITMLLSYICKNRFVSVIVMLVFIIVGVSISLNSMLPFHIDQFIPMHFTDFTLFHCIRESAGTTVGINPMTILFGQVIEWRMIVLAVWMIICFIICSFISFVKVGRISTK